VVLFLEIVVVVVFALLFEVGRVVVVLDLEKVVLAGAEVVAVEDTVVEGLEIKEV
jgi:hypothetical protein